MKPADNAERVTLWVRSEVMVSFPQSHAHFCVALSLRERFGHSTGLNLAGYALDPCRASSVGHSDQGLKQAGRPLRSGPKINVAEVTELALPSLGSGEVCLLLQLAALYLQSLQIFVFWSLQLQDNSCLWSAEHLAQRGSDISSEH